MKLYRLAGDFKKVEHSFRIENATSSRLDVGLVDQYSLNCLTRLVAGGVSHIKDMYAIEMALKALIFHDSIQSITPSAKIQIIQKGGDTFVTSLFQELEDTHVLQDLLNQAGFRMQIGGVDQLIGFSDDSMADEYILRHEENRIVKLKEESERFNKMGISEPSFRLVEELAPIEFVAKNKEEFFELLFSENSAMLNRFLKPVAISGHALYVGAPSLRSKYSRLKNGANATEFFGTLDSDWNKHYSYLNRALNIPIPIFLSIVLNRARHREDIPNQILLLRQEFAKARHQLWGIFDEADFRIFDTKVSVRMLKEVEQEAAKVIPKWQHSNSLSFPISFDFLGRALSLDTLGLVTSIADFLHRAVAKECYSLDAAKLVQKQLETIELRGLIERHLSEQEMVMLCNSVDEWQ